MTIRVVGTLNGSPVTGSLRKMPVDSSNGTAIFKGDAVKLEDDGNMAPAAAGDSIYGFCMGVVVDRAVAATEHPGYLPASTAGNILVLPANNAMISIKEDGTGGYMVATNVGSVGDLVATAGSTSTGRSGYVLDSSDVIAKDATPGSAQLLVIALDPTVGNELSAAGVSGETRWLCVVNESQLGLAQSGL